MDANTGSEPQLGPTMRVVIIGKRLMQNGQLVWRLDTLGEDDFRKQEMFFKLKQSLVIGGIYTVATVPNRPGSVYPQTLKFLARWPDQKDVLDWEAQSRANELQEYSFKQAKKEATRNLIRETLGPIRRAYVRTNYKTQLALEVLVLSYLRTGTLPEE